jgi:hypothetical protein
MNCRVILLQMSEHFCSFFLQESCKKQFWESDILLQKTVVKARVKMTMKIFFGIQYCFKEKANQGPRRFAL